MEDEPSYPAPGVVWSTEVEAARWWTDRLATGRDPGIRSIVPSGFEAVTRIFHPIEYPDGSVGSWAELAAARGRMAHPWMQLHAIATPAGRPVEWPASHTATPEENRIDPEAPDVGLPRPEASEGHLPDPPRSRLARLLAGATTTPEACWFGVWDGYGQLHGSPAVVRLGSGRRRWWTPRRQRIPGRAPPEVLDGPRVRAPGRRYLLLRGPLTAVETITDRLGRQSPNLWWPEDRSWFLVTEIDFTWTYLAGSASLVSSVEQDDGIEALRTDLDHPATVDSDDRNR